LFRSRRIPAHDVFSLVWSGDGLVDWAGGGASWGLDGSSQSNWMTAFGVHIDSAIASEDGRIVVVYERLGTKGVVLVDGRVRREINRSYYCADAYDYPIAFASSRGRTLLVHCPVEYDRLEIEDAMTGETLTSSAERKPSDYFRSQIAVSPHSVRFVSAGWFWHPWDVVEWFDLERALREPRTLDEGNFTPNGGTIGLAEQSDATWLDDDRLLIATSEEGEDNPEGIALAGPSRLKPNSIGVYDVAAERMLSTFEVGRPAGRMMPLGSKHFVAFCGRPRIISLVDGRTVHVFDDLDGGDQVGQEHRGVARECSRLHGWRHRRRVRGGHSRRGESRARRHRTPTGGPVAVGRCARGARAACAHRVRAGDHDDALPRSRDERQCVPRDARDAAHRREHERVAVRGDRHVAIAESSDEIEGLARRLLAREAHLVVGDALLDHRAYVGRRAEESVGGHEAFERLVRPLEVVGVDEVRDATVAVGEVRKHRARQKLVPERLPESLDLAERLRVLRPALDVPNAVPATASAALLFADFFDRRSRSSIRSRASRRSFGRRIVPAILPPQPGHLRASSGRSASHAGSEQ
jgi:hypothetical protein